MRFSFHSVLFVLALAAGSCGPDHPAETKTAAPSVASTSEAAATSLDACSQRMQQFLRWYLAATDVERPDRLGLSFKIPVDLKTDSVLATSLAPEQVSPTKYLILNWSSVENYLTKLGKSGYFSRSYLREKRESLVRRGKALEAAHLEDGEPEGFEADDVFWMMELYTPKDIAQLSVYKATLPAGTTAYRLPDEYSPDSGFILYTKTEAGRCVVDSVAHFSAGRPRSIRR